MNRSRRISAAALVAIAISTTAAAAPASANNNDEEEQVHVGGGTSSNEVGFNLSRTQRTSGTTPRSGARRVSKPPVAKPYSLVESRLRSDPRGGSGPNLNGEEGNWCVVKVVHTSATPFPAARIAKTARTNRRIEELGYPLCARLVTDAARDLSLTLVLPAPVPEIDPGWAITGTYTVKVSQRWNLHWKVGARSGTLTDRHTESTLTLPVREVQPVRIR